MTLRPRLQWHGGAVECKNMNFTMLLLLLRPESEIGLFRGGVAVVRDNSHGEDGRRGEERRLEMAGMPQCHCVAAARAAAEKEGRKGQTYRLPS